jgi:hypothetical protein
LEQLLDILPRLLLRWPIDCFRSSRRSDYMLSIRDGAYMYLPVLHPISSFEEDVLRMPSFACRWVSSDSSMMMSLPTSMRFLFYRELIFPPTFNVDSIFALNPYCSSCGRSVLDSFKPFVRASFSGLPNPPKLGVTAMALRTRSILSMNSQSNNFRLCCGS